MERVFKRTLATIMVVLLVITSVPLSGFVGLDWFDFTLSASAEDDEWEKPDNWVDYSDLTPNQYMAKVLLNYNYTGLANSYNERDITTRYKQMRWYTDSSNVSSALPLYDLFSSNQTFVNSVIAWKSLNFEPSETYKDLLDKEGYYEAILMSILEVQVNDNEFLDTLNSSANKTIMNLSKSTLKILEKLKGIDIGKINLKQLDVSDFTDGELQEIYSELFKQRETQNLYKQTGSYLSDGKMIFSTCTTIYDVVSTVGKYSQLSDFSESVKNVLHSIYVNCPAANTTMKSACKKVYEATTKQLDEASITFIKAGECFINNTFSYLIGEVWKWAKDATLKALGSSLLIGMDLGKVIGKSISNFIFSTDAIIEQFFVIECLLNFENVMKTVVIEFENIFKTTESIENADNYIKALEMLFSVYDLDYDYTYIFVQAGKERGTYNTVKSWISGKDETVESYRSSISSMKTMMNDMKHTLTNLEGYRDYYLVDAPEAFDLFFNPDNSNEVAYSKTEPVINIAPILEVEKSNYVILQYKIESDETATIVNCHTSSSGIVEIPSEFDGYPVKKIGEKAFSDCASITEVVAPNTLRYIAESAFYNCYNLTNAILNEGLNYIDLYAFYNTAITNITIPSTVLSMYGYYDAAFGSFSTVLKQRSALYGMNKLKTVVLKSATEYALYELATIENVIITNDVKIIEEGAFGGCTNIKKLDLPSSIIEIGKSSFFGCTGLSKIIIPEGVTIIGDSAFSGCSYLESVFLPKTLLQIGDAAFRNCIKLSGLSLNNGLKAIGGYAFENSGITEITIPSSIEALSSRIQYYGDVSCFKDSNIIKINFSDGIKLIPSHSFYSVYENIEVNLPSSVEAIGAYAFYGSNISSITFEKSLKKIGQYAFCCCNILSDVYFLGTIEEWKNINIEVYNESLNKANIHFDSHQHSYQKVATQPTCTQKGYATYTCECGDSYISDEIGALGHDVKAYEMILEPSCVAEGLEQTKCSRCDYTELRPINPTENHLDDNGDGYCDSCDINLDSSVNCDCMCHKTGIMNIIWKILKFFYKLFKINPICECGVAHY